MASENGENVMMKVTKGEEAGTKRYVYRESKDETRMM